MRATVIPVGFAVSHTVPLHMTEACQRAGVGNTWSSVRTKLEVGLLLAHHSIASERPGS